MWGCLKSVAPGVGLSLDEGESENQSEQLDRLVFGRDGHFQVNCNIHSVDSKQGHVYQFSLNVTDSTLCPIVHFPQY